MTTMQTRAGERPDASPSDLAVLELQLAALAGDAASRALPIEPLTLALAAGDRLRLTNILRNVPVFEGQLLESGLRALAAHKAGRLLLPEGTKLPLTAEALSEARRALGGRHRGRPPKAEGGAPRTYTPDLIVADPDNGLVHIVDIKRNLNSFERLRIMDLRIRMRAAALAAAGYLHRHHGLMAMDVRTVIINAGATRSDIRTGIWCLDDLDHVLDLPGAGALLRDARETFEAIVDRNWRLALHRLRRGVQDAVRPTISGLNVGQSGAGDIRVGYAEIPVFASA